MRRLAHAPAFAAVLVMASLAAAQQDGATYVGDESCMECHEESFAPYAETAHGKLFKPDGHKEAMRQGCEGCHGPASLHVDSGGEIGDLLTFRAADAKSIRAENANCLECHASSDRRHWEGSTHEMKDVACSSCHQVMKQNSPRFLLAKATEMETCSSCHLLQHAQVFRNGHMPLRPGTMPDREGKMTCSTCHNAHGSVGEAMLKQHTINENCYECHADKRGPFLWEHAPVPENCLNCHESHGSTRPAMLKQSQPRLCQQCHIPNRHPTDPYRPGHKFVIGQSCNSCHPYVHGTNHPSGSTLTR